MGVLCIIYYYVPLCKKNVKKRSGLFQSVEKIKYKWYNYLRIRSVQSAAKKNFA